MEGMDEGGRVWINEGRLVTDGATSVDGCFNSSLPLYILSMLFIRQKHRNSSAPLLKTTHHVLRWFPLSFLLSSRGASLPPHRTP